MELIKSDVSPVSSVSSVSSASKHCECLCDCRAPLRMPEETSRKLCTECLCGYHKCLPGCGSSKHDSICWNGPGHFVLGKRKTA